MTTFTYDSTRDNSPANLTATARRAGWLYLMLVPLGIFALLYIPELIVAPGDAVKTLSQLQQHETLFRWGIVAAFTIQVVQLFTALALYDLFKAVNRRMALYMVIFTLTAMPIAMFNEMFHVAALAISNGYATNLINPELAADYTTWMLQLRADGVMIAHIFWGFWLFPMGYLIVRSGYVPTFMGWLLMAASVAYTVDSILWFAAPEQMVGFAEILGWTELFLPLWLVTKGVKVPADK